MARAREARWAPAAARAARSEGRTAEVPQADAAARPPEPPAAPARAVAAEPAAWPGRPARQGTGGGGRGGASGTGGSPIGGNGGAGATGGAGLPQLTVNGTKLQDPSGKTIILRGSALIDIGALYYYAGQNISGITTRMDKVAAAGVQGHVVRLPVYPKVDYNGGSPTCSPCPYPVGTGPTASCTPTTPVSASDYVAKILKPAVDYATSKNLYVIIDFHQIDNATTGNSAADATTFWTDIAPRFASYTNVIYEPFNEPLDTGASWAALKSVAPGLDQHHPRRRAQEHHHRSVQQLGSAAGRRSERPAHGDELDVHGPRLPEQLEERERRSRRRSRPR